MIHLLRRRDFGSLWLAGLLSLTGDWALRAALPVAVYVLTGSTVALGAVVIAGIVPRLVLGSVAGVFVDRWDRRRTLLVGYLLQGVGTLPLVLVRSADDVWIAAAVAAFSSVVTVFSTPAEGALLPRLVESEELVPANALNTLNNQLARLVGPAVGGLGVAALGLPAVVVADVGSFFLAAVLVAAVPATAGAPERAPEAVALDRRLSARLRRVGADWSDGVAVITSQRPLAVVVGFLVLTGFTEGIFGTLFVPFVTDVLRGSAVDVGLALASQAVGGVFGSIAVGRLGHRVSPRVLVGAGAAWIGLIDLAIFTYPMLVPAVAPALVLFAIVGFSAPSIGVGVGTIFQRLVADSHRGRVFSAQDAASSVALLLGTTAAAILGEHVPIIALVVLQAAGYGLGGIAVLVLARERRSAPDTLRHLRAATATCAPVGPPSGAHRSAPGRGPRRRA